ncbi:ICMT-domain-containing protein [Metschnikowia bicuspidata]|uniref:Protein-S-isoprenylcysteine O-methyltransferase n=1 Tax=Metschnikowia bicuspidata TaxID=27322 RepID=A0A4P9ZD28_9ASCO|nr:ICMT-domain-containing protein [Metschnikowia bicuspidata]
MVLIQGTGLVAVLVAALHHLYSVSHSPVAVYVALWAVFHLCEYTFTARYLPRTATKWLFLLFGAVGAGNLLVVHLASIAEHWITEKHFLPVWRAHSAAGLAIAASGIVIRALAIKHCGNSFSHYIESEKPQKLVTNGIYAWCRHPSYLGFILFFMGMQTVLGNVVVYAVSMVILFRFFRCRIRLEEIVLVHNMYEKEYEKYQERVSALIPFF